MCLAIYKPAGVTIPESHLDEAAWSNPHGAGIAYTDGKQVQIIKGFFDGAITIAEKLEPLKDVPALVHFRWSTQGLKDATNCHPFLIGKWAMIHNGIIPKMPVDKTYSDTWFYSNKKMLSRIKSNPDWPTTEKANRKMVREIGASKLAFLHADGRHVIVNEKSGHWKDGVWYSNDSYVRYSRYIQPDQAKPAKRTGFHIDWGDETPSDYETTECHGGVFCSHCSVRFDEGETATIIGGEVVCEYCADVFADDTYIQNVI